MICGQGTTCLFAEIAQSPVRPGGNPAQQKGKPMKARDRIKTILTGGIPDDRIGMNDTMWTSTIERWHREGLPEGESPQDHFGVDDLCSIGADYSLLLPEKTLEESADYRIYTNHNGVTCKDYRLPRGWVTYPMDFAIESAQDWKRYEPHMAFRPERLPPQALAIYQRGRARGQFIAFTSHASFHPAAGYGGDGAPAGWTRQCRRPTAGPTGPLPPGRRREKRSQCLGLRVFGELAGRLVQYTTRPGPQSRLPRNPATIYWRAREVSL